MPSVDSYYTKIKSYIKAYRSWEETIQKYKKKIPEKSNDKEDHKSFEQIDNELIQDMNKTEQALSALKPDPRGNYSLTKNEIKDIYEKAELWYKKKNEEINNIYSLRSKNLNDHKN
jgi:hypothetical protein